jgi:hypothetical protein
MGKRAVRVGKRGEDRLGQKKGGERERGSVREEQGSKRALRLEEEEEEEEGGRALRVGRGIG